MFLTACIIEKYSESDLLRYFLPQSLSTKENKPEYSDHASRISHWFQLVGYWFRQLFNKPTYQLNSESNLLADSLKQLKTSLNQRSYVDNSVDIDFRTNLSQVLIQLEKKLINSQLEDRANEGISERERTIARREESLSQGENLFSERLNELTRMEVSLRERTKLLSEDREEMEKQNKDLAKEIEKLKETILDLKKEKFSEKTYIRHLETENFRHEKDLEELATELDISILSDIPSDTSILPKELTPNSIATNIEEPSVKLTTTTNAGASLFGIWSNADSDIDNMDREPSLRLKASTNMGASLFGIWSNAGSDADNVDRDPQQGFVPIELKS